jgi:pimeloyl-ACP methyl ester carboxylesterase
LFASLTYLFDFFPDEQRALRSGIRDAAEEAFPEQAAEAAQGYGLALLGRSGVELLLLESDGTSPDAHPDTPEQDAAPRTAEDPLPAPDPTAPSVLLVHGLDDPGKVWRNLAPVLIAEGLNVWQIRYPNDQPLLDSAWFLAEQMRRLRAGGVEEIAIVAHSMGGLVAREMLTNPEMAYGVESSSGRMPRVTGLVMIATPNHGSEMARFRLFGEFREQWINMLEGRGPLLQGILDGAGEAKLDLLPGSEFLRNLNARPEPAGVAMLTIAGDVSPWARMDLDHLEYDPPGTPPTPGKQILADLGAVLESMSNGSGDGLVTVRSTLLDGVPHEIVPGTHLTVIRNLLEGSDNVPPAIPLVTAFLAGLTSSE